MKTIQTKELSNREDLTKLVVGDVVEFGVWREKCLVYDYPFLKKDELFLISRLETTEIPNGIGVIFNNVTNLLVKESYFRLNHKSLRRCNSEEEVKELTKKINSLEDLEHLGNVISARLPKTRDGIFHYGVNLVLRKVKNPIYKKYEKPEKWEEFDKALNRAGL